MVAYCRTDALELSANTDEQCTGVRKIRFEGKNGTARDECSPVDGSFHVGSKRTVDTTLNQITEGPNKKKFSLRPAVYPAPPRFPRDPRWDSAKLATSQLNQPYQYQQHAPGPVVPSLNSVGRPMQISSSRVKSRPMHHSRDLRWFSGTTRSDQDSLHSIFFQPRSQGEGSSGHLFHTQPPLEVPNTNDAGPSHAPEAQKNGSGAEEMLMTTQGKGEKCRRSRT